MPEASDEVSSDGDLSACVHDLNNVGITRDKQMILSRLYATVYKRFGGYNSGKGKDANATKQILLEIDRGRQIQSAQD